MSDGITADMVLQNINYFVTIKRSKEYLDHFNNVVDYIIDEMRDTNSLFRALYSETNLVGSYPDRLKVSKPDEFDVNICLKFKQDYHLVKVTPAPRQPGYCFINLRQWNSKVDVDTQMKTLLDGEGYLLQDKVNIWMHNICKQILKQFDKISDDTYLLEIGGYKYKVSFSLNGPAYTFSIIVLRTHIKLSVDLAVGFGFDSHKWVAHRKDKPSNGASTWYAVPKPNPKRSDGTSLNNSSRSFVCSYANLERTRLYKLNGMKCLLRLFKKLRDTQDLSNFISYHIKVVFLWEINKQPASYWENSLMELFLDMFEKILEFYERKCLPSFWDPAHNLLGKFDVDSLSELESKLRRIYNRILKNEERNPEYLIKVFLTEGEIKQYHCRN